MRTGKGCSNFRSHCGLPLGLCGDIGNNICGDGESILLSDYVTSILFLT